MQFTAAPCPASRAPASPAAAAGLDYAAASWDPLGAEPPPVAADLVVGLGLGARLRAGALLPEALRQAAAPGAALLLAEPLPGPLLDFCCGQDAAWWAAPGGALPGPEAWEAALVAAGWSEARTAPLSAAPWPALLLAARAPEGAAVLGGTEAAAHGVLRRCREGPLPPTLAAALQARGATVVQYTLAEAARIPPQPCRAAWWWRWLVAAPTLAATLTALGRLAAAADGAAAGFRLVTRGGQQPARAGTTPPPPPASRLAGCWPMSIRASSPAASTSTPAWRRKPRRAAWRPNCWPMVTRRPR